VLVLLDRLGGIHLHGALFMVIYHLMETFGWGSLTSPRLDGACACCLVVFSHVLTLLITPWLHF
jgi:hypothetical protein